MSNSNLVMLSTTDNPYDPFSQFDEWNRYDTTHGYKTLSLLARLTNLSNNLTEEERNDEIDSAIERAAELNLTGNYIKIKEGSFVKRVIT